MTSNHYFQKWRDTTFPILNSFKKIHLLLLLSLIFFGFNLLAQQVWYKQIISGLNAGTYLVQIKDALDCTFYDTIVLTEPIQLAINLAKVENLCSYECNGELIVGASGGTLPYQFSIDNGVTFQTNNSFTNLCSGLYQINVTDNNNCDLTILGSLIIIDNPKC